MVRRKLLDFLFRPQIRHDDSICEWKRNAFHRMLFALLFTVCLPFFLIFIFLRMPVMAMASTPVALSVFTPTPLPVIRQTLAVHVFETVSFGMNLFFLYMLRLNDSAFFLFFDLTALNSIRRMLPVEQPECSSGNGYRCSQGR